MIGPLLQAERTRHGWSTRQAAARTDGAVTHTTIGRIEAGTTVPNLTTLQALARLYDITITLDGTSVRID